jgi:ArsR family transcriptional regulator
VVRSKAGLSLDIIQDAARVLKCIGHPVRLRIIELLDESGELNVGSVCVALELEQAIASQHLTLMRDRGILHSRRDGVNVYYGIADEKVPQVIECLRRCDR